jgi:hypothetical protein
MSKNHRLHDLAAYYEYELLSSMNKHTNKFGLDIWLERLRGEYIKPIEENNFEGDVKNK